MRYHHKVTVVAFEHNCRGTAGTVDCCQQLGIPALCMTNGQQEKSRCIHPFAGTRVV